MSKHKKEKVHSHGRKRQLFFFRPRLSLQEQSLFAKRLSLLLKADASLHNGIAILQRQARSEKKRQMFQHILHDVANGQYLAKSLERFRNVFGDFAINLILVGETSGTLPENLAYLADEIEKRRKLRQKAVSAMLYPIVIMVAALGISGLMTVYLFPKILPIFQSLNVDLPFTTRALIWTSHFLIHHWLALLLSVIAAVVAFALSLRSSRVRFAVHKVTLGVPVVGPLVRDYYLANMFRTLGILLKSHMRLLEAFTIAERTSANLVYRKELGHLSHALARGGAIAKHLEKVPKLFPDMATQMVAIGETTGSLSDTLLYLAQMYEEEFDERTKRLSSVIEPSLMLVIGLLVGFIAVSVITPIYEVTQHLNPR